MTWYYAVAERRHEIQNPTSAEKIRLLGERMRLAPHSHVLDVASGMAGPALILASAFGWRMTCVEHSLEFHVAAEQRVAKAELEHMVDLVHADARDALDVDDRWDAALCLGATFIWGGLGGTLAALAPTIDDGGYVAIGEPYWRRWPLPDGIDAAGYTTLTGTLNVFTEADLEPVTLIASSEDDWDRYETLHWLSVDEWLRSNEGDPDAPAIREQSHAARDRYVSWQRDLLGWAIFVGRKP